MKREVVTAPVTATIAHASSIFCNHHIGTLPVVDEAGNLEGILQLRNFLELIIPDFENLMEYLDHVDDFGAIEDREPTQKEFERCIAEVMEEPICVQDDSGLVRAFAFIIKHELLDLPIVDRDGRLVGLASRVDIGRALLPPWCQGALSNDF
jgi:CBS-domain-containing membrane protein